MLKVLPCSYLTCTGSNWDNLLLAAGAITVQNSAALVQTLTSLSSAAQRSGGAGYGGHLGAQGRHASRLPVDVVLVDPLEYATMVVSGTTSTTVPAAAAGRFTTPTVLHGARPPASTDGKSPAAKMTAAELAAVQRCLRLQLQQQSNSDGSGSGSTTSSSTPVVVTTDWIVHCLALVGC